MIYEIVDAEERSFDVCNADELARLEHTAREVDMKATLKLIESGEATAIEAKAIVRETTGNPQFKGLHDALIQARGAVALM